VVSGQWTVKDVPVAGDLFLKKKNSARPSGLRGFSF
jgi:hypothetical protein